MKKIKVLHISNTDFFMSKLMLNKIQGLKDRGYEVHAMSRPGEFIEAIKKEVIFHPLEIAREISIFKDIKCILQLTRFLKNEKFDIVHTHSSKAGIIGRIAAKLSNTPITIHTAHGLPFYQGQGAIKYNIYRYIERLTGKITSAILSQNKEDMEKILKYKIGTKDNVFFEGNGVNIKKIDETQKQIYKNKLVKELNIQNHTTIGFYARIEPVKGHLYFLEAFEHVVKKYPNTICLMAGSNLGLDASYHQKVLDKIAELGLTENIKLLGFRNDIYNILSVTDIVVLPSQKEGLPRIVMEAMTFKKPVIGTDVLGTREIVKNGYNGLLIPYANVEKLDEALCTLIANVELRKDFGENGRRFIEENFNEDKVIERLDQIYQKLLQQETIKVTPGVSIPS